MIIIDFIKNIFSYGKYVQGQIQDFYDIVTTVFNLIPSPFKEMLTAALIGFMIIIGLKVKEKIL